MYNIRQLGINDTVPLQQLNELFGEVFDDPESYHRQKPSLQYLSEFLKDYNHVVLVVENSEQVVAGLVAYCLSKFEQERKEMYVYDLAVATSMQHQGLGTQLMQKIQNVAKTMGAYVVFVQADEGDDAVKFYEALKPSENSKSRSFDFNV